MRFLKERKSTGQPRVFRKYTIFGMGMKNDSAGKKIKCPS